MTMYHQPLTKEEAAKHQYGQWAGEPKGSAYMPDRCAAEVFLNFLSRQCARKAGKGPDGLYCGIHATKVKIKEAP
jgi:hypothetical protein